MKYASGIEIEPGDIVSIDTVYRGKVVASMDTGRCLPGHESWGYLGVGIMVDTDFGGLVHYTAESALDEIELIERPVRGA